MLFRGNVVGPTSSRRDVRVVSGWERVLFRGNTVGFTSSLRDVRVVSGWERVLFSGNTVGLTSSLRDKLYSRVLMRHNTVRLSSCFDNQRRCRYMLNMRLKSHAILCQVSCTSYWLEYLHKFTVWRSVVKKIKSRAHSASDLSSYN